MISSFRHFMKSPHLGISSFRHFMAASGISSFRHFVIWRTREGDAPPQKCLLAFRHFVISRELVHRRQAPLRRRPDLLVCLGLFRVCFVCLGYVWVCLGYVWICLGFVLLVYDLFCLSRACSGLFRVCLWIVLFRVCFVCSLVGYVRVCLLGFV